MLLKSEFPANFFVRNKMVFIKSILMAIFLYSTTAMDSITNLIDGDTKSVSSLRVVGIPWIPFAYFEKRSKVPRGFDVSLVAAVAEKMKFSIDIQLNGTDLFDDGSSEALLSLFVNRYIFSV